MKMELQIVDRRDEIAEYERENRRWPRAGSVSKGKRSLEPDNQFCQMKWAQPGKGQRVVFVID